MTSTILAAVLIVGAVPPIYSHKPYEISFPAQEAKCVRLVIHRTADNSQPCLDELEVFGPKEQNLALAERGAKASASSCYPSTASHRIEHLNDGQYGNGCSWIPAGTDAEWAQIELPGAETLSKVVISRDREQRYADRVPVKVEVLLSMDGREWKSVKMVETVAAQVVASRGGFQGAVPEPPPVPSREGGRIVAAAAESLEVEATDALGLRNLSRDPKAKAGASSAIAGFPIHRVEHLNDGRRGNDHSWVAQSGPAWAEIDLGDAYWVYKASFASDASAKYADRAATTFSILAATEYAEDSKSDVWTEVYRQEGGAPVQLTREFKFKPVKARWIRVAVESTNEDPPRLDELAVFGDTDEIPLAKIGPVENSSTETKKIDAEESLKYASLGEQHAWLKTYGRADLSTRLVPYNGRVTEYPRHVGSDTVSLPPVAGEIVLDGKLDEPTWSAASRGVARVAFPYDWEKGALVECAVRAGLTQDHLLLAVETNQLLSAHVAGVSLPDGEACGVLALSEKGLEFRRYGYEGQAMNLTEALPVEGAFDESLRTFEIRLPREWFPEVETKGLRIGLGMGGKHTSAIGQPVFFSPAGFSIAECGPCKNGTFRVRLAVPPDGKPTTFQSDAEAFAGGVTLSPGESMTLELPATGPIGPQHELQFTAGDAPFALELFRYDPTERVLTLMDEMLGRFTAKGMDVSTEKDQYAALRRRQAELQSLEAPDVAAERELLLAAAGAKRRLFFREPDLEPLRSLLFVKRHAFEPSHNYSVILDSPWRPGGSVCRLDIPTKDGRLVPEESACTKLFESGEGIARNPMADFDVNYIYFGYRPNPSGYFHIMRMRPDGGELTQLTDGPFHDYWPCPLPDGDLAFISTRCKCRFLCWRPQAFVLFRMEADGTDMRPLSYANLSEWAPSVMSDGRIIWTRSEYVDKAADFSHTLWAIRPDGTKPELVFGNTIIQPNGYANGREVPGTNEICCTLISHFGDLNGPITLIDIDKGRFNQRAIQSITPEVPWPGMWPNEECFRDPVPVATDYFLVSHAPRYKFGLYVIDRYGNREAIYFDDTYGCMCPTMLRKVPVPPVLREMPRTQTLEAELAEITALPQAAAQCSKEDACKTCGECRPSEWGTFMMADVYQGIAPTVKRGEVKYIRVACEVRANLEELENGEYRKDHEPFMSFYAGPVDVVSGPYGWPSYVAKASFGLAPVEEDGSAHFYAPANKQIYLQILDKDYNELQRMRSVVQLQPGESRSCIGCHEDRRQAPTVRPGAALRRRPDHLQPEPWGTGAVDYEKIVQPILDAKCVQCHNATEPNGIDLSRVHDQYRVPASYRNLIRGGWVHYLDYGWNSGGNEKRFPLTFGTVKSKLFPVIEKEHHGVTLSTDEMRCIKIWVDMNCPLWPDYQLRETRPLATTSE